MTGTGLRYGDEYAVFVYKNREVIAEITGEVISGVETAAKLYTLDDEGLLSAAEIVHIALGAVKFYMEKPRLQEMLKERIEELKRETEEAEWEDPPAPSSDDLPF